MPIPVLYQPATWAWVLMVGGLAIASPTFIFLVLDAAKHVSRSEDLSQCGLRRMGMVVLVIATMASLVGGFVTVLEIALRNRF